MRVFLASYRFGARPRLLLDLLPAGAAVAVIANAADAWSPAARESAVRSDTAPLQKLGFRVEEVDLRDYMGGQPARLSQTLQRFGLLWVRGGNTFVLRAQLLRSGGDAVLRDLLAKDALIYAGYSAGACVMSPSLRGLEVADDPAEVWPTCGVPICWDGLGVVDFAIVPHYPPAETEDALMSGLAERYRLAGIAHRTLTDEQVVLIDGGHTTFT